MTRQICYDGAVGARAIHTLQKYGKEESVDDGKPYTFNSAYHNGHMQLYAHHSTAPAAPGGRPEYHTSQLKAHALTNDRETFLQGATALRNTRDLAKQHRATFIKAANDRNRAATALVQRDSTATAEAFHTAQEISGVPLLDERGDQLVRIQKSDSLCIGTEQAPSTAASLTPSVAPRDGHDRGRTPSKRYRDLESSPSGLRRWPTTKLLAAAALWSAEAAAAASWRPTTKLLATLWSAKPAAASLWATELLAALWWSSLEAASLWSASELLLAGWALVMTARGAVVVVVVS
ncbi:hypothetical protein VP1G_10824 [Cytospora mali]|uniref:Uncharacterized protein n=1 Tax=Cytospora mali TaxID=578113 RepID=A0A194UXK0_CYTMA|nr:hypothetical protein VP1G_10824 [Valsa mali var. pyri (nom. inval.)]